jgi:hypothetical protein
MNKLLSVSEVAEWLNVSSAPSPNLTHLCIISVRGFSIYPCDMGDVE